MDYTDPLTAVVNSLFARSSNDDMDEDEMSVPDSPLESGEMSPRASATDDRQRATLQSYLDSLPYECEPVEDMQAKLEYIVGKIAVCAKSKNWLVLTTWDGALQWYVPVCTWLHRTRLKRAQLALDALPRTEDDSRKACSPIL